MRLAQYTGGLLVALAHLTTCISFDCGKLVANSAKWDLSPLAGPHTVHHADEEIDGMSTTFTFDICTPLKKNRDVDSNLQCESGARICAVTQIFKPHEDPVHTRTQEVAGVRQGAPLEVTTSRLKGSSSHSDTEREGVRVEIKGPRTTGNNEYGQKAIIEFLCNHDKSGLEGMGHPGEDRLLVAHSRKRADHGDDDDDDDDDGGDDGGDHRGGHNGGHDGGHSGGHDTSDLDKGKSVQFVSYKVEDYGKNGATEVLRLEWETRYACEDQYDKEDPETPPKRSSKGWGFFTWIIVILFMFIAAYLIFGSWLNYSRYGARGWDLLPHGDTIRDLPYLLKDWTRRVISTVQGGGSRGGYNTI